MLNLKNISIRRKQTLIMMLTSSVVLLLACAAFSIYEVTAFRNTMKQNVATLADIVDHNVTAALDFNDPKSAGETLSALSADPTIIGAWVYTKEGQEFASYDRPNDSIIFIRPTGIIPNGIIFQGERLILNRPILLKGETVGTLYLETDMQALHARLTRYALIAGLVFLASLLLAFMLSSQLQRLVSTPILHLAHVARTVAQDKNYSLRAEKHSNDEIGQLVDGFNEMLVQIQTRDDALQTARAYLELRVEERTKELAESQSLYHSLVDQMPAGIFRKDAEGRYVFVNSWFCRIKDMAPDQILGKTPRELAAGELAGRNAKHPEAARETKLAVQGTSHHELIMETGKEIVVEEEYPGVDGHPLYLRAVKSAVFGPDGKIIGTQGMLFDVTERRQAEAELSYERELLRALMDNSPDHIYFKDVQSRFIKSSKAQAIQFGATSPDELVGKTDFDFFTEEHARPAFEDEQEVMRTGQPMIGKVEKEILKSGRESWVLTNKMPLRDKDGQIIGTFGISKNITAIKQAEDLLAYERDLLKTLMDNFPDSIYFKDLQSRFVRVSRSKAERAFAFSLEKHRPGRGLENLPVHLASLEKFTEYLAGKSDFDFLAEESARSAFEEEQQIIRTGKPIIGELKQMTHLDGKIGWYITTRMPWNDKGGNLIGTFGTTKDVTFIKEAEAKLEQVHKQLLETSRQAGMAEIATNVLHNVGNVLNSVNVSAGLVVNSVKNSKVSNLANVVAMLQEHEPDLGSFITTDPKGKKLPLYLAQLSEHLRADQKATVAELDSLLKNIEHIKEIVTMQQSYARVSGVKEIINIVELVEDGLRMNVGALGRHRVEVVREFEQVPLINIDKHKVLQVLVNLIRNAKHACQESERADKRLTVRVTDGDGRIKISVVDNGVGIPAENLTHIFNHGFTTRKDGHGFGLHSGALAAKEMGGSLNASSDGPGKGATFTLELPCDKNSI